MGEQRYGWRIAAAAVSLTVLLAGCGGVGQENNSDKAPAVEQPQTAAKPETAPGPARQAFQPLPGYQAANFTATDVVTGKSFRLSDLRGQIVFLNFWATWCPPCKVEMPEMQKLHEEMGDKVRIIALGADPREPSDKLASFGKSMGLTFTIAYDRGIAMEAYQVRGIPTSYFIDKEGVIRVRHLGPMTLEQMKGFIAETEQAAAAAKQ